MAKPRVCFLMANEGHDPTETVVPFDAFQDAGFDITFATENGDKPTCDPRMLTGVTGTLLGASGSVKKSYDNMIKSKSYLDSVLSWTSPDFDLSPYNLVFLPGGHEKSVRQVIDSSRVHDLLLSYFPLTEKSPSSTHAIAAICHGVLVLAETLDSNGDSVMKDLATTTLPGEFEGVAYWGTRAFLGDYYKTYGAGSENCEVMVKKRLKDAKKQFKHSLASGDFVVEDERSNYLSGRFPGDAQLLADKCVEMVQRFKLESAKVEG